jgi:uncharacterized membrane protein YdjX (TVP38/TMEM64 family)
MSVRAAAPRLAMLALLVGAAGWGATHAGSLHPEDIAGRLGAMGAWAPLAFVLAYVLGAVLLFPAALLTLAGGAAFGPLWGSVLDVIAAVLGAGAAFLAARYLGADWVRRRSGPRLARLIAGVEAEGWRFVAAVRLLPILPYSLMNYAFGLTRIGFWPYLAASAVCMVPGSIAYTWLGYAGRRAINGDLSALRYGLLGLGLLALVAVGARLARRLRAAP